MDESKDNTPAAYYTEYWRRVRRLTRMLLTSWGVLLFVVIVGAPFLDVSVYGVPLAYWLISSVLLPSFLVLVLFYAWRMDAIESATIENSNECLNPGAAQQKTTSRPDSGDSNNETQSTRGGDPGH